MSIPAKIISFDKEFSAASVRLVGLVSRSGLAECTKDDFVKTVGVVVRLGLALDETVLSKFANLQFVATVTTGLDHVALDYCSAKGIAVLSLKGERTFLAGIHATPEHTWALLLALLRKLPWAHLDATQGKWRREAFFGHELFEKQLGILGCGRIGSMLVRYGHAFGMKVQVFDKTTVDIQGVAQVALESLLATSDIICCCLLLDDSTHRLIGRCEFERMNCQPWLVNTSRGQIIDETALLWALNERKIKGAALDVLNDELSFTNQKITSELVAYAGQNTNLIITPHIAGSTIESMEKTSLFIEEKIRGYLCLI